MLFYIFTSVITEMSQSLPSIPLIAVCWWRNIIGVEKPQSLIIIKSQHWIHEEEITTYLMDLTRKLHNQIWTQDHQSVDIWRRDEKVWMFDDVGVDRCWHSKLICKLIVVASGQFNLFSTPAWVADNDFSLPIHNETKWYVLPMVYVTPHEEVKCDHTAL